MRAPGAADHAVDLALVQQHRADQRQAPAHLDLGELRRHALALRHAVVGLPVVAVALVVLGVDEVVVAPGLQAQAELLERLRDHARAADQRRPRQRPRRPPPAPRAARALPRPRRRRRACARCARLGQREDRLHRRARGVDEGLQLLAVGVHVGDRARRHAAIAPPPAPPPARSASSAADRTAWGSGTRGRSSALRRRRPPPRPRSARPAPARRSRAPRRSPSPR